MARLSGSQRRKKQLEVRTNRPEIKGVGGGQGNRKRKSPDSTKTKSSTTKAKAGSARAKMEAKNRSIHGDAKIDALKAKHAAWKEARKRKNTKKSK